jgi:drug/metabolite transporter (DMT)-like permease
VRNRRPAVAKGQAIAPGPRDKAPKKEARMTALSTRHPQAYGFLVTFLGVAFFFPDALVVRLIGADTMTIAVWRGLAAAVTTFLWIALFDRSLWPGFAALLRPDALAMILLQGTGSLFFLASLGQTSVANSLLILATAPFLAAVLSWVMIRETIDTATGLAILAVFSGVAIIAVGSWGGGRILGDLFALLNALTIAGYYVVLRRARGQSLIAAIACGYLFTALLALPFAPMPPFDLQQSALVFLSGGVILAAGVGLLQLGPRYLPAPEVTMITMLEIVIGPLLVWWVLGENPGQATLWGGGVILIAIIAHAVWQLRHLRVTPDGGGTSVGPEQP